MLPFTVEELEHEMSEGYVTARPHNSDSNYTIYNYAAKTQYDRNWNQVTLNCRGLILDNDYNVIARGFPKFFNYTELVPDPVIFGKPCFASEKLDGSLGIIYPINDGYAVATRGSFHSDQAEWATKWLNETYPDFSQPDGVSTLVEIIYPDNRIVLNYGDLETLVLIGAIFNDGIDIQPFLVDWWDGQRAKHYPEIQSADEAYKLATSYQFSELEGLVMTWYNYQKPAYRLKVKHAEYIRLHSIIHSFSYKKVWQALADGEEESFLKMLEDTPDEWYKTVHEIVLGLNSRYWDIEKAAIEDYKGIAEISDRRQFALRALDSEYKSILFAMLDGKDYSQMIWKMLEPRGDQ